MPADDVSDLKDVFDAINRLCDTMKTSDYEELEPAVPSYVDCEFELVKPEEVIVRSVVTHRAEAWEERAVSSPKVETEAIQVSSKETCDISPQALQFQEIWAHTQASPPSSQELSFQREERSETAPSVWEVEIDLIQVSSEVPTESWCETSSPFTQHVQEIWIDAKTSSPISEESIRRNDPSKTVTSSQDVETNASQVSSEVPTESWSGTSSPSTQRVREIWADTQTSPPSSEEISIRRVDCPERWSDCRLSLPETVEMTSDTEPAMAQCEPISEMYYTASSEVSLLSDSELPERVQCEDSDRDDRKECVIAGHVAAMRERFESMTRANTPCPDLIQSTSPSLDVFRNITPSPDHLG